jgi:hypothetical protein
MHRASIAVAAGVAFLAAGCGGSSPAPITTFTVSGKVTTSSGPVVGAKVRINQLAAVTTDGSGAFTVDGVSLPYDALVGDAGAGRALLYVGLTRLDPSLNFGGLGSAPPNRTATIEGTVSASGGSFAGALTMLSFGSADFDVPLNPSSAFAPISAASSVDYTIPVVWRGASTLGGTVHALQWNLDPGTLLPTAFTWHGSQAVTVNAGVVSSGQAVAMTPLSTTLPKHVAGDVEAPGGYTVNSRWFEVYLEPGHARLPVFCEVTAAFFVCKVNGTIAPAFDFVVPSIDGATATVWVNAVKGDAQSQVRRCRILPGSTGVHLVAPLPPEPGQPAAGAIQVGPGTTFSWTPFSGGGIHALSVSSGATSLMVFTAGAQAALPDLAPVGLAWPAATVSSWTVAGFSAATMDGWADPVIQTGCDFTLAASAARTFTTP